MGAPSRVTFVRSEGVLSFDESGGGGGALPIRVGAVQRMAYG